MQLRLIQSNNNNNNNIFEIKVDLYSFFVCFAASREENNVNLVFVSKKLYIPPPTLVSINFQKECVYYVFSFVSLNKFYVLNDNFTLKREICTFTTFFENATIVHS